MGGGFFDNMWDPYSGAYAYPRTQPRARYYRPQAPGREGRPYVQRRGSVQPENHFPGKEKVEGSARTTARTIPVTDGSVPVEVKVVEVKAQPVVRFLSEEAAARKIQAVYRGYSVRRTEPLKHLRVILKVREEFQGLKRRLEDREVRVRVAGDARERLRWTEGIMALLLRLDQLQGVHPEVRVFRKAAAKELLMFQEKLDSMTQESVAEQDVVGEEENEACHAAEERAGSVVEKMEVEEDEKDEVNAEDSSEGALEVEMEQDANTTLEESKVAVANDAQYVEMEQDAVASLEERKDALQVEAESDARRESGTAPVDDEHTADEVEGAEISSSEPRVPQAEDLCSEDHSGHPSDGISERMAEDAEQDGLECTVPAEVPMDVEVEVSTTAPARVEDASSDKEEVSGVDDALPFQGMSLSEEAELADANQDVGAQRRAPDAEDNKGENYEESVIDGGGDGWIVSASPASLSKSTQVSDVLLSDRALLEQLVEENRKLKDVVGKVLHWGKQQNDIIHSLATRIEHLEGKQQQHPQLPGGEQMNGRKRICNEDGGLGGDRARSQRSKGRRKGGQQQHNRHQLGYLDSEWLSADSDEYF